MQKRASFHSWLLVAGIVIWATLSLSSPDTGADYGAVELGASGPNSGDMPKFGLRGAADGNQGLAGDGPVEQHRTSEVGRGITDIAHQREVKWESYLIMRLSKQPSNVLGRGFILTVAHQRLRKPE